MTKRITTIVIILAVLAGIYFVTTGESQDGALDTANQDTVATTTDEMAEEDVNEVDTSDRQYFITRESTDTCESNWNIYFGDTLLQENVTNCSAVAQETLTAATVGSKVIISFDVNTNSEFSLHKDFVMSNQAVEYELSQYNTPGSGYISLVGGDATYVVQPKYDIEGEVSEYCTDNPEGAFTATGLGVYSNTTLISEEDFTEPFELTCSGSNEGLNTATNERISLGQETDGQTLTVVAMLHNDASVSQVVELLLFDLASIVK